MTTIERGLILDIRKRGRYPFLKKKQKKGSVPFFVVEPARSENIGGHHESLL